MAPARRASDYEVPAIGSSSGWVLCVLYTELSFLDKWNMQITVYLVWFSRFLFLFLRLSFFFFYPQTSYKFERQFVELLVCEIAQYFNIYALLNCTDIISLTKWMQITVYLFQPVISKCPLWDRTSCHLARNTVYFKFMFGHFLHRLLSRPENWLTEEHARVQIWENVLSKCETDNANFVLCIELR